MAAEKKDYNVLAEELEVNGEKYAKDAIVSLTEADAKPLLDEGKIEPKEKEE